MLDDTAVVEMARASGLALLDEANDPLRATTRGTGQLIRAALDEGAPRVIVAVGGSATVDGGLGALEALDFDLGGADVVVACDVTTTFVDAARVFGPQKGADPDAVDELERRLTELAERYAARGVDVRALPGGGAAGGLAGGLAAIGARLAPGAALVAEIAGLRSALSAASLAITGRGTIRCDLARGQGRRPRARAGPRAAGPGRRRGRRRRSGPPARRPPVHDADRARGLGRHRAPRRCPARSGRCRVARGLASAREAARLRQRSEPAPPVSVQAPVPL